MLFVTFFLKIEDLVKVMVYGRILDVLLLKEVHTSLWRPRIKWYKNILLFVTKCVYSASFRNVEDPDRLS